MSAGARAEMMERLRAGFAQHGGFGELDSEATAGALVAALEPYATEDFTSRMVGVGDIAWNGLDGLRDGWTDFLEGFEQLQITPEETHDGPAGDCIVEFVRIRGRPRGTSADIEQDAAAVWRLRGDRVCAVEFHLDRAAALRSGGFEP